MKDILDRELKKNDLVLGMTIGRYSDGIRFGVFNGSGIYWQRHRGVMTSTVTNVYLIENPLEQELEIKKNILDAVDKIRREKDEAKAKRKALKRIPTKDLVIGETYVADDGYKYVYLGIGSVTRGDYPCGTERGYIYLSGGGQYDKKDDVFVFLPSVTVLKNPKKLVEVSKEKTTDYVFDKKEFTLKRSGAGYWYSNRNPKSLTFKLGSEQL